MSLGYLGKSIEICRFATRKNLATQKKWVSHHCYITVGSVKRLCFFGTFNEVSYDYRECSQNGYYKLKSWAHHWRKSSKICQFKTFLR